MIIPFATQSYQSRSLQLSAQRCLNMFAEQQPAGTKSQVSVFNDPGIDTFVSLGSGPVRGMWNFNNVLYIVSGPTLYSVTAAGVATALGTGISGTNNVAMSDNGTQLIIINNANGYIWSQTAGFSFISSVNFHAGQTVSFFDNYFVLDWGGTNQFFISGSLDGTTYSALDFASAMVNTAPVVAVVNQQENLLIFTGKVIETWYDSGSVNFPFQRYDGATIERGCASGATVVKEDNSVFFLGNDLIFYRLNGVIPVRISTHAIETAWQQYPKVSDAFTFNYSWQGHKFLVVTFPSGPATWVYDIATNLWHEKLSFNADGSSMGRWRANCTAFCYDQQFVGDTFSGQVGIFDESTTTEWGNLVIAQLSNPVIHSDRHRVFMPRFELDVQTGVGLDTGQGSNPQIMVDWSNDGGMTFTPQQIWNSMGQIGAYKTRLRWLRLGQSRNRVMRVSISDPVPRTIIANNADLRVAMS